MKPMQTVVLLLILVVMVFAVTFASMYVRQVAPPKVTEPDDGGPVPEGGRLTFGRTKFPEAATSRERIMTEVGGRGQYDFWFVNDYDKEVFVGLNRLGC